MNQKTKQTIAIIFVIATVFYLCYILGYIRHFDFNPSATIRFHETAEHDTAAFMNSGIVVHEWGGYDGTEFFKTMHDLDNSHGTINPYRYSRIGYPLTVVLLSFTMEALYPVMSLIVTVLSILIGTYFSILILLHFKRSPWWSLLYVLNPGYLVSSIHNVAEPMSGMFQVGALYFFIQKKPWHGAFMLGTGLLFREDGAILFAMVGLFYLLQKGSVWARVRRQIPLAVGCIPYGAWYLYVAIKNGGIYGGSPYDFPFMGMIKGVMNMTTHHAARFEGIISSKLQMMVTSYSALVLIVFIIVALVIAAYRYFHKPTLLSHVLFLYLVLTTCIGAGIWHSSISGAVRIVHMLIPLILFNDAENPSQWLKLLLLYGLGMTLIIIVGQQVFPVIGPYHLT